MIRDPSDGSVREPRKIEMTSALAPSKDESKRAEQLQRSREWLRNYLERKSITCPAPDESPSTQIDQ